MRETATTKTQHRFRKVKERVTRRGLGDVAGYRNVNLLLRACLARTMTKMLHSAAQILLQRCFVRVTKRVQNQNMSTIVIFYSHLKTFVKISCDTVANVSNKCLQHVRTPCSSLICWHSYRYFFVIGQSVRASLKRQILLLRRHENSFF